MKALRWSVAPELKAIPPKTKRIRMNLLLWRHGTADETDDATSDALRGLSTRGRKQVAQIAGWLQTRLPSEYTIYTSPALRTQQTAEALTSDYRVSEALGPDATPTHILNEIGWPGHRGTVIIVGHQPALGRLASFLIFGEELDVSIKKGALWWIANRDREDRAQNVLRAVASPDLVLATHEAQFAVAVDDRRMTPL